MILEILIVINSANALEVEIKILRGKIGKDNPKTRSLPATNHPSKTLINTLKTKINQGQTIAGKTSSQDQMTMSS